MPTFAEMLQRAMAGKVGAQKLSNLTGIPKGTIESWLHGQVQRPRMWQPILTTAQALLLNREEADTLLQAAHHPTIAELVHQITADHPDRRYLQPWLAVIPLPPSARHQLRAPVGDFVGRTAEIAGVRAALLRAAESSNAVAISGVRGMGGIGKTELAYMVAREVCHAFPDAQIVLNLRGASTTPLPPEQSLQQVIHAFTPDAKLPDELEALQHHYRSVLHDRRVLILVDDARDASQVRPLLPPPGSALLITSRTRFTLPAMATVDLVEFCEAEAIALLRSICTRLDAATARMLVRYCGFLPLALRVSGSILSSDPALSVDAYLERLGDQRQRLTELRDPEDAELDVAGSLAVSYALLEAPVQRFFRQLGVFVADFATSLARAVVEAPQDVDVEVTLRRLLRRNLITYDTARGRWRLHDLLRDLARQELAAQGETEAVMWRYAGAAVQMAEAIDARYRTDGSGVLAALAQFDTERSHIDTARHWATIHAGTPEGDQLLVDDMAATMSIGELRYDTQHERIPQAEHACAAARRLGNQRAEATALTGLGFAYTPQGNCQQAILFLEQALTIFRTLCDQRSIGRILPMLGRAYDVFGNSQHAIVVFEEARTCARALGDRRSEGWTLHNLGSAYIKLGNLQQAMTCCEQALVLLRASGDQREEGYALFHLAGAQTFQGHVAGAITTYEQALSCFRAVSDRAGEGWTLTALGQAYLMQDDMQRAIECGEAAYTIMRTIGYQPSEADALCVLANARRRQDDIAGAITAYEQALAHYRATGARRGEGYALLGLGQSYMILGDTHRAIPATDRGNTQQAMTCGREALALSHQIGDRRLEGYALGHLSQVQALHGDIAQACAIFEQALACFRELDDRWGAAWGQWRFALVLAHHGDREQALPLLHAAVAYEQEIGHTKTAEHAALVARLEAGELLPVELHVPKIERAIRGDSDRLTSDDAP